MAQFRFDPVHRQLYQLAGADQSGGRFWPQPVHGDSILAAAKETFAPEQYECRWSGQLHKTACTVQTA